MSDTEATMIAAGRIFVQKGV